MTYRLAVSVLMTTLVGCASLESMQRSVSEAFGGSKEPPPSAGTGSGEVFYVGRDGLKLYDKPSGSSAVMTTLRLDQRVTRYRQERGYAYVEVDGTAVRGWVDNAQLAVRKAAALPPAPAPQPPQAEQPAPPPAEPVEAKPAEQRPALAEQPAPVPAAPAPARAAPPEGVTPAVFDPF